MASVNRIPVQDLCEDLEHAKLTSSSTNLQFPADAPHPSLEGDSALMEFIASLRIAHQNVHTVLTTELPKGLEIIRAHGQELDSLLA